MVEDALSDELLGGSIRLGEQVHMSVVDDHLAFEQALPEMVEAIGNRYDPLTTLAQAFCQFPDQARLFIKQQKPV